MTITRTGNTIQWYFNAKRIKEKVCELKEAAENCPTSCGSKQECFGGVNEGADDIFFTWDRCASVSVRVRVGMHAFESCLAHAIISMLQKTERMLCLNLQDLADDAKAC